MEHETQITSQDTPPQLICRPERKPYEAPALRKQSSLKTITLFTHQGLPGPPWGSPPGPPMTPPGLMNGGCPPGSR